MNRKARAVWQGTGKDGSGHLTADSGVLSNTPYSFKTRFENEKGTNPEELIAAAHAGCFSMQLSGLLTKDGHPPRSIRTTAKVRLDVGQQGADITAIELETEGIVPGIDAATFAKAAEAAKEICPVSKALKAVKTSVKATLKS